MTHTLRPYISICLILVADIKLWWFPTLTSSRRFFAADGAGFIQHVRLADSQQEMTHKWIQKPIRQFFAGCDPQQKVMSVGKTSSKGEAVEMPGSMCSWISSAEAGSSSLNTSWQPPKSFPVECMYPSCGAVDIISASHAEMTAWLWATTRRRRTSMKLWQVTTCQEKEEKAY